MRRLMTACALTLIASGAHAGGYWTNVDGDECKSRNFGFDGRRAYVVEETIDAPSLRKIDVRNAPVKVTGGNSRGYTITVCKAAVREADLSRIRVSVEGGTLVTHGPEDDDDWNITYRISAPYGANLDIESRNGPLALQDLDNATLNVRLRNGPLALHDVSGNVDAETQNGPVSIDGGSGNMKVKASNGPVSVTLEGASWEGGTLEATTRNGPLSVKVSRSFASGVLVEAEGRGPVSCRAQACEGQLRRNQRDWDTDDHDLPRRFELGRGPQVVRLSTVNGPVTIKDAD
jgi:hypothetical protein